MMKSIDEGIRCNIIQCLAYNGAMDSERISSLIGLDVRKTRKILNSMEDDGTVVLMNSGNGMIPFLSNRRQWTELIGKDKTMTEMGMSRYAHRHLTQTKRTNESEKKESGQGEIRTRDLYNANVAIFQLIYLPSG